MSFLVTAWAETAPVADVYERSIITCMAHKASSDGTGCYRSIPSMAAYACCDDKTIERRLVALRKRGVIAYGDQTLTKHLPRNKRPRVYDLLVPYVWYSDAQREEVNEDRARRGLGKLCEEDRPPLVQPKATGRKPRSDRGAARPQVSSKTGAKARASKSEDSPSSDPVPSHLGGLTVPPDDNSDQSGSESAGGSNSPPLRGLTVPPRGVYKTPNTVPLPTGENSPVEISPLGGETPPPRPPRTDIAGPGALVVDDQLESVGTPTTRAPETECWPAENTLDLDTAAMLRVLAAGSDRVSMNRSRQEV